MIRFEPTRHVGPADLAPPRAVAPMPPASDLVVVSARVLEEAIAALAPFGDVAGDPAMLGVPDAAQLHPHLEASAYRTARIKRRALMAELDANVDHAPIDRGAR